MVMELKKYAAFTDQGPFLQLNEDTVEIDLVNKLFFLLDGFGGNNVGERAVEKIKGDIKEFYSQAGGDAEATLPFFFSHKYLIEGNVLINSVHYAHEQMKAENHQKSMSERGGASGVIGAMAENIMTFANTGNCAGHLYRKGKLSLISRPDNLELVSGECYERHFCTAPASGFGLFDKLDLEVVELRVLEDDLLLLLSDGVYSRIQSEELKFILQKSSLPNGQKIKDLFALANSRGNLDNQSAVILQF